MSRIRHLLRAYMRPICTKISYTHRDIEPIGHAGRLSRALRASCNSGVCHCSRSLLALAASALTDHYGGDFTLFCTSQMSMSPEEKNSTI
jgi:hypothetical protein